MSTASITDKTNGKSLIMLSHDYQRILIFIETTQVYCHDIIRGVKTYANQKGNWILSVSADQTPVHQIPNWIFSITWDGIIARTCTRKSYEQLTQLEIPYVELLGIGGAKYVLMC